MNNPTDKLETRLRMMYIEMQSKNPGGVEGFDTPLLFEVIAALSKHSDPEVSEEEIEQIVFTNRTQISNEDFDSVESFKEAVWVEVGRQHGIREGLEIARDRGLLSPKGLTVDSIEKATNDFSERTRPLWQEHDGDESRLDDHATYVMGYRRGYEEGSKAVARTPTNPRPEMKTTHRRIYVKAYRVTLDNTLVKGHYRYVPRKWSDARRTAEDKRAIKVWEGKALDIPAGGFR